MFESYCAVANGQKLHVAMSETDEMEFIDAITDDLDAIYEPYKKIDASRLRAGFLLKRKVHLKMTN